MKASDIPAKFAEPFAKNAAASYIRTIPTTSGDPTVASLDLGFPPATATPVGAGGVPPNIADVNGILNQSTSWDQWLSAGGAFPPYDAAFQTAIGGYPKGATLAAAAIVGNYWISTVDNNVTDPDTGGAGWTGFSLLVTGYSNMAVYTISGGVPMVSINGAAFTTTGATTFPAPASGRAKVRLWGGGGGAGGSSGASAASTSGGGAGYSEGIATGLTGSTTIAVGGPGIGGANTGANGTAGGLSSFGSVISATGGGAGTGAVGTVANTIASGGTGTGGTFNQVGNTGGAPYLIGTNIATASGGASFGSGQGGFSVVSSSAAGGSGNFPGQGGGGAVGTAIGGAGAPGVVIIEW